VSKRNRDLRVSELFSWPGRKGFQWRVFVMAVNGSDLNRILKDSNVNSLKIYKIYIWIRIQ
jgi:hypothetical protein